MEILGEFSRDRKGNRIYTEDDGLGRPAINTLESTNLELCKEHATCGMQQAAL